MRQDGPVPLGILGRGGGAVVRKQCIRAAGMAHVHFEGICVLVFCQVVGGVRVAGRVFSSFQSGGFHYFFAAITPYRRADGFTGLMGAGGCQPLCQRGFYFYVAYLSCFGDVRGDVYIAVSDVGPREACEFGGAYTGKQEQGKCGAGFWSGGGHESGCFIGGEDVDCCACTCAYGFEFVERGCLYEVLADGVIECRAEVADGVELVAGRGEACG